MTQVELGGLFDTQWLDKSLLISGENFNKNYHKNYRLPLKRLYGWRILENHKEVTHAIGLRSSPPPDGQIACHCTHLFESCDMEKKPKSKIYSVYYRLNCCIEEWKLTVGGRSPRGGDICREMILQITLLLFQDFDDFDLAEKPLLIDFS